jgi:hypothetical protein
MRKLRRIVEIGPARRKLLCLALLWVVGVHVGLRVMTFCALRALLDRVSTGLPIRTARPPEEIRWSVAVASRIVPGARCLARALALRGLLAQSGIASELRIGVAKTPEGHLVAHAWVDLGGIPPGEDLRGFAPLAPDLRPVS